MKLCLVIDDSSVIRKVARTILSDLGYLVVEAENGEQALEQCRNEMPDAIFLDWDLPDMSGFDFLVAFRNKFPGQQPHIVYATTENDPLDISRSITTGASDYVTVPFDRAALSAKFPHATAAA